MSNEMAALIKERQRQVKNKKNQAPYGMVLLVIAIILCVVLWQNHYMYAICWIMGVGIGIIIRYSRFCFASAFRDPFLVGNTKLLRGILLALMVSTIGFAVIQSNYLNQNTIDYDLIPGAVSSVGIHVMIGAFLFGVGMVIAGGCASGVLMRIGEGHALQWVVLLGFIIGTVLGAKDYSFWYDLIISKANTIYFSEYLDLKIVVLGQMVVLIGLYRVASWYEKRQWKDI
ncbi:YeeE/YedE thiosulfate transporter family protein [Oceanirhabdus seepicola]|uniref:YeeE/YedE family protein n=1 Tax=Oceanirhabdus seepicola TaxID=2828781 RepID=A0A9J6NWN0_9CLOT|nr:YeeE/YedE thiosulfate transporter family protein [Oceanirhabdus seepicola]MCM1988667.1 YeeE/YedE family protein [Oceanirhabdus seepicola]